MSDWDTFRFLAEQAKKQKQPPPVQPPPWGSEMCPRCERWTRLVVNQQEGKVTCDRCSVIVDGVIVDHNPDIEWTKTIMDEKVHDGEITRVEANELSTVISRRNGKDARTRMRMATIQHSLENECPLLFEELARTVLIDGDNTNVPPELQEAPDAEKIKWLSGKLAKRYKTQLKDLGIKKVGPQREAVAWVHRLNNKLAAGHRALGLTLTNLATFIAAYPDFRDPLKGFEEGLAVEE